MTRQICPDRESLELLLSGRMASPSAEDLQEHLLECDECSAVADTISSTGGITEVLRAAPLDQGEEELIQAAIARAKLLPPPKAFQETVLYGQGSSDTEESIAVPPEDIDFLAPPEQPDEIGRMGNYRVLDVLGIGGMGVVFRAEDPKLKRLVALKVMKPAIAASRSAKDRFLREAEATAAIEHDNIVTIFQVGEDRGIPFFAMRYLRGESLWTRLNREKKLDQREVVVLGRQIASGLAAAHGRGLIHRDIKPDNIWLDSQQHRAKILDFGLVHFMRDDPRLTQTGMVLGTPRYMAPEQANREAVDHRCDLFSLGSVLYHLASGRPAFDGPDVTTVLLAVSQGEPQPIGGVCPEMHPDLAQLIMRLLSKPPDQRPQTAAEVAQTLAQIEQKLDADPNSSRALSATVPINSPFSETENPKWRWLLWGGGIAAMLLLGLIIKITRPDRTETRVQVPFGSESNIDEQGNLSVTLPRMEPNREDQETSALNEPFLKKSLPVNAGRLFTVVYSPDGKLLAAGGEGTVRVWDAQTGRLRWALPGSGQPWFYALVFSPDSKLLLTAPDAGSVKTAISLWNANTGKPAGALEGHAMGLYELSFSADGKTLLSCGSEHSIRLWDFEARRLLREIPSPTNHWSRSAVISSRGKIAFGQDRVFLANSDGSLIKSIETSAAPLAFSPNGRRLAGTTWKSGLVTLWDGETGDQIASWQAHQGLANGVTFSHDGRILATAGGDEKVRLWDVETLGMLAELPHDAEAYGVAFSPEGTTLATTGYDCRVKLWDVPAILAQQREQREADRPYLKKALRGHKDKVSPIVFSADGRLLASSGVGTVCVWDVPGEKLLWALPEPVKGWYMAAAFSPDGKYLLTAPEDGRAKAPISIWEAETGKLAGVLEGHNQGLFELSFSPDGKTLMSGGWEGFVRLWDFAERRKIRDIPSPTCHWIRSAVFSGQGKIAFGQDKVYLFEQDGTLLNTIDKYAAPYCFSPDGKLLAGTRWEEGGVTIWDVDTGEEVASWRAHDGKANGIAYSFQGRVLATAGSDGKVRLWDVNTQRQLAEFSHDGEACGVAFSPDGVTLASTGYDYLVKLWDVSAVLTPNDRDSKTAKGIQSPADAPPPAIAPFDSEQAKKHQEAWAKQLGVPVEKVMVLGKDKDGKDVKLSMVLIPPGEFLLGSPDDEQAKFLMLAQAAGDTRSIYGIPAEGPQRSVRITKPFWLGRHEITMAQFRSFVKAANYKTVAEQDGLGGFALVDHEWQQSTQYFWNSDLGFPRTESHPVSNVTWDDATAYCEWLAQQSGWPVSLPSEAQWEYACRAGTTTYFHSGNSEAGVERYAWVGPNSNGGPRPAGLLKPNAFGLYDMHGNMWEWCADWFGLDSYAKGPLDDPTGPSVGSEHVIRGGGWITYTRRCRAAHRGHYPPDKRVSYLGFRVAAGIAAFEDKANGHTNPSPAIAEKP